MEINLHKIETIVLSKFVEKILNENRLDDRNI